jgi:hypothetical protein
MKALFLYSRRFHADSHNPSRAIVVQPDPL